MIRFILLMLVLSPNPSESIGIPSVSDLKSVLEWGYEFYSKFAEAYDLYGTVTSTTSLDSIMTQLSAITNQIDDMGSRLEQKIDAVVQTLIRRLPLITEVKEGMKDISKAIIRVDHWYSKFEFYVRNNDTRGTSVLEEFAKSILSHSADGLEDILNNVFRLLIPGRSGAISESLLISIKKATEESRLELCDVGVSPQQRMYQLYSSIIVTEMRSYAMMTFAYSYLASLKNESFVSSLRRIKENFDDRIKTYMVTIQSITRNLPRDIRTCDPPVHNDGKTFVELTMAIQNFIVNEVDLNSGRSCQGSCESQPKPTRTYGTYDSNWDRAHDPCEGEVVDCTRGGGQLEFCQLTIYGYTRYDWYKTDDGTVYGPHTSCPDGWKQYPYGWTSGAYKCDYCICTCVATKKRSKATYIFSLRKQVTDVKNNMVVTGARIVKKDKLIHIQIEQGKLGPDGTIVSGTNSWIPLEDFKIDKDPPGYGRREKEYADVKIVKKSESGKTSEDRLPPNDYMILRNDDRTVYLDDVYVPADHLITGVRFESKYNDWVKGTGLPLLLEVQMTPFNYEEGKLTPEKSPSKWVDFTKMPLNENPLYKGLRKEIILKDPNVPTKSLLNMPDSVPNTYIKFRVSDKRKDAGRSTIPFLDILPISGKTKFPLQGIGLFHKGAEGFGGFLSLRIMGIDVSKLFNITA